VLFAYLAHSKGGNVVTTQIIFVRHGQTEWNYLSRYQGHTDVVLSEEGIKQAHALRERFKQAKLEAIYSSDLQRAIKTAEIINKEHQLPLQILPELREIYFGEWEGLTHRQIEEQYADLLHQWWTTPHLVQIPGGESLDNVQKRSMRALKKILAQYQSGQIMIVAHGVIIATMICGLLDIPQSRMVEYKQDNTAVTMVTVSPQKATLDYYNDLTHLKPLEKLG